MGGIVCEIPRKALLRFESVPTAPAQVGKFDEQVRQTYANPIIAAAVVEDTPHGAQVCAILGKPKFTHLDRVMLLSVLESLYEV